MSTNVILLDTSGSMEAMVGHTGKRRIDILKSLLDEVLKAMPQGSIRTIVFGATTSFRDEIRKVPEPAGGTPLHMALDLAATVSPQNIFVFCDGQPDLPDSALESAAALNCQINTYFCGDDDDTTAIAFMRQLAFCSADGIGKSTVADLTRQRQLTKQVMLLLTGPQV